MKVLVFDQNKSRAEQIAGGLDVQGHTPDIVSDWDDGLKKLSSDVYQIMMVDDSFFEDETRNISSLRRASRTYVYIILMGVPEEKQDFGRGVNAFLPVTFALKHVEEKVDMASDFVYRVKQLSNESEDFPSAGGVISKSAFNQLFLSSMDRAWRYGEQAHVLFVSIENYKNILVEDSEYSANHAAARLAYHLSQTRRQSDILAQTATHEYAILFLRPVYPEEPHDATKRFSTTLSRIRDYTTGASDVEISLRLQSLPSGTVDVDNAFKVSNSVS